MEFFLTKSQNLKKNTGADDINLQFQIIFFRKLMADQKKRAH